MSGFVCAILFPHDSIAVDDLGRLLDARRPSVRAAWLGVRLPRVDAACLAIDLRGGSRFDLLRHGEALIAAARSPLLGTLAARARADVLGVCATDMTGQLAVWGAGPDGAAGEIAPDGASWERDVPDVSRASLFGWSHVRNIVVAWASDAPSGESEHDRWLASLPWSADAQRRTGWKAIVGDPFAAKATPPSILDGALLPAIRFEYSSGEHRLFIHTGALVRLEHAGQVRDGMLLGDTLRTIIAHMRAAPLPSSSHPSARVLRLQTSDGHAVAQYAPDAPEPAMLALETLIADLLAGRSTERVYIR
jgi:hypothetical protein